MLRSSLAGPVTRDTGELHVVAAAIASLALRGYIAFVWLRFGIAKLQGGWLTTNPLKPLFTAVAAGQLPTTMPGYGAVAKVILATHADALLSVIVPFAEIAIGIALLFNIRPRTAALIACVMNVNLLMAGVASFALDGRMVVLQLILIALLTMVPGASLHVLTSLLPP